MYYIIKYKADQFSVTDFRTFFFLAFGDSDAGAPIWEEKRWKSLDGNGKVTKTYTLIAINEGIYGKEKRVPRNYYSDYPWLIKIPQSKIMRFIKQIIKLYYYPFDDKDDSL